MLGKIWTNPAIGLFWPSGQIAGSKQPNRWVCPYFTQHFFREYLFQSASNKTLKPLMKIQLLIIPFLTLLTSPAAAGHSKPCCSASSSLFSAALTSVSWINAVFPSAAWSSSQPDILLKAKMLQLLTLNTTQLLALASKLSHPESPAIFIS